MKSRQDFMEDAIALQMGTKSVCRVWMQFPCIHTLYACLQGITSFIKSLGGFIDRTTTFCFAEKKKQLFGYLDAVLDGSRCILWYDTSSDYKDIRSRATT